MAESTKIIRTRIRSVKNTKKITRAMELVSAAKMRRAVHHVLMSRAFAQTAWDAVLNIFKRQRLQSRTVKHPFLQYRHAGKRIAIILMSSNRGLCGGFNTQVIACAERLAEKYSLPIDWVTVGKQGAEALARSKKNIAADFAKSDIVNGVQDVSSVMKLVETGYLSGLYQRVFVVYTDFVSSLVQKPRVKQLLPFEPVQDNSLGQTRDTQVNERISKTIFVEYEYEPSPEIVLDYFLKRLLEVQLYQALLESTASEHAARMLAMRQATDAATDMIDGLTLVYNQARQSAITREIAEISSGKAALE